MRIKLKKNKPTKPGWYILVQTVGAYVAEIYPSNRARGLAMWHPGRSCPLSETGEDCLWSNRIEFEVKRKNKNECA